MADNRLYWLWLQQALLPGCAKTGRLFETYGTIREFYEAGRESWRQSGLFTAAELQRLSHATLERARAQLDFAEKLGQSVICPDDAGFPVLLREIPAPPCVLYYKGELPPPDALCIAMVGTRSATADGIRAAGLLAHDLAKEGVVVVSGGAVGIDAASHIGALQAGGRTLCILGCGIDYHYLMQNADLRETISQNGALISEYPPNTPATPQAFPVRNRIISGLCAGTVVVEAPEKSGALITASTALEQGRDVFAVPGTILNPEARGVNRMLRDGAKPALSAQDILEEYPGRHLEPVSGEAGLDLELPEPAVPAKKKSPAKKRAAPAAGPSAREAAPVPPEREAPAERGELAALSEDAAALYAALRQEPRHIEELSHRASLPIERALTAMTELELAGWAHSFSGRRFSR